MRPGAPKPPKSGPPGKPAPAAKPKSGAPKPPKSGPPGKPAQAAKPKSGAPKPPKSGAPKPPKSGPPGKPAQAARPKSGAPKPPKSGPPGKPAPASRQAPARPGTGAAPRKGPAKPPGRPPSGRDARRTPDSGGDRLEGRNVVLEALRAGRALRWIRIDERAQPHEKLTALLDLARERGVPVTPTPRDRLDALSRTGSHNGVIAEAEPLEPVPLPRVIAAVQGRGGTPWIVALGGAPDPDDVGAVLRTADAVGVSAVVLPPNPQAPEGPLLPPGARRVAMGAAEHLPLARVGLVRAVAQAREAGLRVVAVTDGPDLPPYTDVDLTGPLLLILTDTPTAIPFDVRRDCDAVVQAPGRALPLSLIGAVVMYERERQSRRVVS